VSVAKIGRRDVVGSCRILYAPCRLHRRPTAISAFSPAAQRRRIIR